METPFVVDWAGEDTRLLLNPRMPGADRERLERLVRAAPGLTAHVWLATSGTTGALKVTALSKEALLASAAAVNRHLQASRDDVWCCVLPTFHVGGLSIFARAWLNGARVVRSPWSAQEFVDTCTIERVTLTSLVPAQVSDLVQTGLHAPRSMRAAVVGGGAFPLRLYEDARSLGWPVLPSYGMTECCSQVATALGESPELLLLDHVEARAEEDGRLALRSSALLTGYATERDGFFDPKADGWFVTEDLGDVEGRVLRVSGRRGDFLKIGGESVDLARLDAVLAEVADPRHVALVDVADERLGHVIALAFSGVDPDPVIDAFNARVQPFERIRRAAEVAAIPRTSLGKLMRNSLRDALSRR